MNRWFSVPAIAALAAALCFATTASAQAPVKFRMANLGFPSAVSILTAVVTDRKLDRKHGIDIEVTAYGAISAYYATVATGEMDGLIGGPLVFQRMRQEGVPIKIVSTLVDMTTISLITKDPAIKTVADLKGKTIAADMSSAEYSVLSLYAKRLGLTLGKDVTVVQAGPPLVRTQLAANRVDAGLSWEPTATLIMRDNPANRIVFSGKQGWKELTGKDGWLLSMGVREDWLAKNAAALPRLVAVLDEASRYMRENPDDADRIMQQALKLPPGAFKEMITAPRVVFNARSMADPVARETTWEVIRVAVSDGYFKEPVRDQSVIHVP